MNNVSEVLEIGLKLLNNPSWLVYRQYCLLLRSMTTSKRHSVDNNTVKQLYKSWFACITDIKAVSSIWMNIFSLEIVSGSLAFQSSPKVAVSSKSIDISDTESFNGERYNESDTIERGISRSVIRSSAVISDDVNQFLTSYRLIANCYHNLDEFNITPTMFYQYLIQAVPLSIAREVAKCHDAIPADCIQAIVDRFCADPEFVAEYINIASTDIISTFLLKILSRHNRLDGRLSIPLVRKLLTRAIDIDDRYHLIIIEDYILKKPYGEEIAQVIAQTLFQDTALSSEEFDRRIVDCLDIVARQWSSPVFISKGDEKMQKYLTTFIIASLRHCKDNHLQRYSSLSSSRNPLVVTLSNGISSYLDADDSASRQCGMRVAKVFAHIMGHDLHFEELQESISESIGDHETKLNQNPTNTVEEADDDESDSDTSELEAYDLEEPNAIPRSANYLKECVEMLASSEPTSETYDRHIAALNSIPNILRSNPADYRDYTVPLTKALLHLTNLFNIENFESLRRTCLISILTTYPALSSPVAIWAAVSKDFLALGGRLDAMTCLIDSSYRLAGIPSKYTSLNDSMKTMTNSETGMVADELSVSDIASNSKTTIKRPRKLALSRQKKKYYQNRFSSIASVLYYPTLQSLINLVKGMSSSSSKLSLSLPSMFNASIPAQAFSATLGDGNYSTPRQGPKLISTIIPQEDVSISSFDGLDALLPSRYLQGLIAFTECSRNTIYQQEFLENTLKIAIYMKDSTMLSLRRVALDAISSCMEIWQSNQHSQVIQEGSMLETDRPKDALSALMNMTQETVARNDKVLDSSALTISILEVVDWAVNSVKNEPDNVCRAFKYDIIRLGVQAMDDKI